MMLFPVRDRVNIWDDTLIEAGTKWEEEIQQALAEAKVAVLLVTPNFLRSDFITRKELPPILKASQEEGLKILWVAVSPSLYEKTFIAEYQAINNPSKPLDGFKSANEQNRQLVAICNEIVDAMDGK
jgi:internalin A